MNYSKIDSKKTYMPCFIFIGFDKPPESICNDTIKWIYSKDLLEIKKLNNQAKEKVKTHLNTHNKWNVSKTSSSEAKTTNNWLELTKSINGSNQDYKKAIETSRFIQPKDDFIANLFPHDKKVQNYWKSLNISKDFMRKRQSKIENLNAKKSASDNEKKDNISLSSCDDASMLSLRKELYEVEKKLKGAANYYESKLN